MHFMKSQAISQDCEEFLRVRGIVASSFGNTDPLFLCRDMSGGLPNPHGGLVYSASKCARP